MHRIFKPYCKATVGLWLLGFFSGVAWAYQALAAPQAVEYHKVTAVKNGKSLTLENGWVVRLASVQAPNIADETPDGRKRPGDPLGDASKQTLETLVLGQEVRLVYGTGKHGAPIIDKHGRHDAQLYLSDDRWVQGEMLKSGMAYVYTFPDHRALAPEMLALEREARAARRGIWAEPYFQIIPADQAKDHLEDIKIVEGRVVDVSRHGKALFIDFGEDYKTDFTLLIDAASQRRFKKLDVNSLKGKLVRTRGWIFQKNGPMIELTHEEQLEVLE